MARQKFPQHKDDCIKCTLPEPNGVYHACMNCRNKAVEENKRLQIIIDDLECREKQESNTKASLLADVGVCTCGTEEHAECIPRDNGMMYCGACDKPY